MRITITISKIDTGFLVVAEDSMHAITSNDKMIDKVRELLDISLPKQEIQPQPPTTIPFTEQLAVPPQLDSTSPLINTLPIKRSDYIVPDPVPLPNNKNVTYFETKEGRLLLKYSTTSILTTFDEINQFLEGCREGDELKNIPSELSQKRKTCIRQFMIAVRNGLKPGDSIELDPDKDFRPLNISSNIEYERGTLEEIMVDWVV